MFSQTRTALQQFDNDHDFELMAADILNALGYTEVVPIAPQGGSDEGKDITFTTEGGGKGLACVTLRGDMQRKFNEDFKKRKAGEYEKYILFCTAYLTAKQKLKFTGYCLETLQALFVPYDLETLRSLLDSTLKSIRETYLHIRDDDKGVSDEDFAALREEMQKQREADTLLLEADKFASSLVEKDRLINKAVEKYPPYKQRELRRWGIEMSTTVLNGYDPIIQMGIRMSGLGRGMVGYRKLGRDDMAWLTTSASNYLQENVLEANQPDSEGLLYLACMYGYQQQCEDMIKVTDKAIKIDEGIKERFQERKILLTLFRACGSDQMKLEKLRKKLGISLVSKKTFCKFIQDFDLTDFQGFIRWIVIKRPNAAGEKGIGILQVTPPYGQNKGLVSGSVLSVESWQPDHIANGELMSVSTLYDTLHTSYTLFCPTE